MTAVPTQSVDPPSDTQPAPHLLKSLLAASAELVDEATAIDLGGRVVDAAHDVRLGTEVAAIEAEEAVSRLLHERAQAGFRAVDDALASEPIEVPACYENGGKGDPSIELAPWRWALRDQLAAGLAFMGFIAISLASFFGVQVTLADAELPIFERVPVLTYMLATLAPCAALGVKFIGTAFTRRATREVLARVIAVAAGISFFVWIPLFSGLFEGLSGVFDPFAEPNHLLGWSFNLVHIVTEVLIGAALYGVLDGIMAKYTPSHEIPNPRRIPLIAARADALEALEAATQRHGAAMGALRVLNGQRDLDRVAAELAIRERHGRGQRDSLLGN
ncbi:MAG: hypothetical protein AAGF76_04885 [Pseudomonadota bacterium]